MCCVIYRYISFFRILGKVSGFFVCLLILVNPSVLGKEYNSFLFLPVDAEFASNSFRVSPWGSTDGSNVYEDLLWKTSQEYVQTLTKKDMIWMMNSKSFPTGLFTWSFHCFPLNLMRNSLLKENIFILCVYDNNVYGILSDVSLHLTYFLADLSISTVEFSIF